MTHGIVTSAQPEATEAGALALMAGGNAIDAAIAAALVQGVVDPLMTGLGGVGTAIVRVPAAQVLENVNFLGAAPAAAHEAMWSDRILGETGDGFGFVLRDNVNALGHQAVMVPGNLKAYGHIHSAHGRLPWADVCQPAIDFARDGWMVRPHVYTYATQDELSQGRIDNARILGFTETGRELYLDASGRMKRPGANVVNPQLAATLETIASEGPDSLYRGSLASVLTDDMRRHGGLIDADDLARYEVTTQPVLWGHYRDRQVATNRPGGSGVQVLETLGILEHFDLQALGFQSAEYLRVLAEALAIGYQDKRCHVGDPTVVDVPIDWLLDKTRAAQAAERIRRGERHRLDRLDPPRESPDTTQICALDEHGNALTMTHTLGAPSGVIAPGTGFILNGCMGIFDPRPGRPTSIGPGKCYTSSMSPAMVFEGERLRMIIGAPGATYIPQAIIQALVNSFDFDHTMLEAVAAPRIAVTRSETIDVSNRIPRYVTRTLAEQGYAIARSFASYSFAGVHGIGIVGDRWQGAADPGRDGATLAV